jgi:hypothetical protein
MAKPKNKPAYTFKEFILDIKQYAKAYGRLEEVQAIKSGFIPEKGDQKTGLIGEAFIFQYLLKKKYKNLRFGHTSMMGWDIEGKLNGKSYTMQVKTVSGYSQTRIMSPIHQGWDKLYLLSLDQKFIPNGLWMIEKTANLNWTTKPNKKEGVTKHLSYQTMKSPAGSESNKSGAKKLFDHARDIFPEFKKLMSDLYK